MIFTKPPLDGLVFDQDKHTYVYFSLSKSSPTKGFIAQKGSFLRFYIKPVRPKGLIRIYQNGGIYYSIFSIKSSKFHLFPKNAVWA
jgi:hypothetical protein